MADGQAAAEVALRAGPSGRTASTSASLIGLAASSVSTVGSLRGDVVTSTRVEGRGVSVGLRSRTSRGRVRPPGSRPPSAGSWSPSASVLGAGGVRGGGSAATVAAVSASSPLSCRPDDEEDADERDDDEDRRGRGGGGQPAWVPRRVGVGRRAVREATASGPARQRPPALRGGLGVVRAGGTGRPTVCGRPRRSSLGPGQQLGIGLHPGALLVGHLVVEVGGGELVGARSGRRSWSGPWTVGGGSGFPSGSASSAASAARPREMRERTVPAGMSSTSAISA